jgi:hypothetical protein
MARLREQDGDSGAVAACNLRAQVDGTERGAPCAGS